MKNIVSIFTITSLMFACTDNGTGKQDGDNKKDSVQTETTATDTSKKSIPSEVSKRIGNTDIKINYYSPGVRGRVIWGGLVPYHAVWVTGAHSATSLEVGKDFKVGDKVIPAGKYAIFTIPGKEEWTVIINKNWNQHQADNYSEAEDMVRFKVKPKTTEEIAERLKYEIDQTGENAANIIISWEKLRVPFGIEIR